MRPLASFALEYLLNSLWQVPLLFLCGWLAARLLRPLGALAEHRVWVITLCFMSLLPACSLSLVSLSATLARAWRSLAQPRGTSVSVVIGPGYAFSSLHLSANWFSIVSLAYAVLCAILFARFCWRALALAALRRSATILPLAPPAAGFWQRCSQHFNIPTATLAESSRITGPVTLGIRRRLILLPATMLASLSEADLHTVLAHEFAHMHRRDFPKNLVYELLALPISYHPLLWLTRDHLTQTREIVCDQLAATLTGRQQYARSLLHLASLLLLEPPFVAPHAIGILDAHTFERRLMHLTETPRKLHGLRRAVVLTTSAAFAFATCTTALALHVNLAASTVASTSAPSSASPRTARVSGGVMAGQLLTHVNPTYPQAARDAKIQGAVVLHAVVGKDGAVENLTVISGPAELRASALDAVHQWIYKPYLLNGEPTQVETTVTVNYALEP